MSQPFVSVIMPVRNEERYIALSLGAVLHQDYPAERLEVLVADGASDDATRSIIAALPGADQVRVIANPERTQADGMNLALREARGAVVVRVDGHTVIEPDYVRMCVAELARTDAQNVGGGMQMVGVTETGKAIAAACRSPFAVPTAFHTSAHGQFTDTVYLGAWPRWVFDRVGEFDARMVPNEDYELNYRIRQAGGRIYLSPNIHSHYFGRQTLGALALQYGRYGRGKVSTLRKSPASMRPRQLVAPAFVAALAVGASLALVGLAMGQRSIAGAWGALVLAYVVLALGFALAAALRAGWALFWRIALAFAVMHLAWGAGFWAGLLRVPARVAVDPTPHAPEMAPANTRAEADVAREVRGA